MDAIKANSLAYAIKYIKSELQYAPESPVVTITLRRDDFKEIVEIAEKEVEQSGASTIAI